MPYTVPRAANSYPYTSPEYAPAQRLPEETRLPFDERAERQPAWSREGSDFCCPASCGAPAALRLRAAGRRNTRILGRAERPARRDRRKTTGDTRGGSSDRIRKVPGRHPRRKLRSGTCGSMGRRNISGRGPAFCRRTNRKRGDPIPPKGQAPKRSVCAREDAAIFPRQRVAVHPQKGFEQRGGARITESRPESSDKRRPWLGFRP